MCGRFTLIEPETALAELFEAVPGNDLPAAPRYNICPTRDIAVVAGEAGRRRLRAMRWGFLPRGYRTAGDGPLLINARAETIAVKPAFREAARARRCLVPASGFYEWRVEDGRRQPYYIRRRDGRPMAMAAIWQDWAGEGAAAPLATCAIVTTAANAALAPVHHRMPLVLEPDDWALWLGEAGHGAARLMRPAAEAVLGWHAVGPGVNSNRAEGPGLIAPVDA